MYQPLFSFFRIAPVAFAAVFVAANTGCIINASDFSPPVCVDLAEVCPALSCEFGNVVDDADCEICECKVEEACDVDQAPPSECANPRFDEAECEWLCDPVNACRSDDDCSDGFFCAFVGSAEAPSDDDSQADPAPPSPEGQCLPYAQPDECTTDSDCDRGESCVNDRETNINHCIVVTEEQPCVSDADCYVGEVCLRGGVDGGADNDGDAQRPIAPPDGVCSPAAETECSADEECAPGYHCEGPELGNGLIALPVSVCVLDPIESCLTDLECLRGQRCDFDRGTANALIALSGTCVDIVTPDDGCFNDGDCRDGQHCELHFADLETRRRACDPANGNCDPLPPLPGTCVDDVLPGCSSDADCHDGDYCDISSPANGLIACDINEATGACDPIANTGVCRSREDIGCNDSGECADGEFCDFGSNAQRPAPPFCDEPDGNCDVPELEGICRPIPTVTECFNDDGCGFDEYCDFGFGPPRPLRIAVGTCQPLTPVDTCFNDGDCRRGQVCDFDGDSARRPCQIGDDGNCIGMLPPPLGICVDAPNEPVTCIGDEQCADDQVCVFDDGTIAPGDANRPARTGVCKARIANPCETIRCVPGTTCVVNDGEGQCIRDAVCTGDQDCADGLSCNAGNDVCNQDPSCRPGEPCIDVCYGFCVAP